MPTPFRGFNLPASGKKGTEALEELLRNLFAPFAESERQRMLGVRGQLEPQFFTPGASFGQAREAAEAHGQELFRTGGPIQQAISGARGGAINQGFAPESALGAERAIQLAGAESVGRTFSQQAGALEQQRLGSAGSLLAALEQSFQNLPVSLFTGQSGIEQLRLAQTQQKREGQGLFGRFKSFFLGGP